MSEFDLQRIALSTGVELDVTCSISPVTGAALGGMTIGGLGGAVPACSAAAWRNSARSGEIIASRSAPADLRSRIERALQPLQFADQHVQRLGLEHQRQFGPALQRHQDDRLALGGLRGLHAGGTDELLVLAFRVELLGLRRQRADQATGASGAHFEAVRLLVVTEHVEADAVAFGRPFQNSNISHPFPLSLRDQQLGRPALARVLEQRIGLADDLADPGDRRHEAFQLGRLRRFDQPHRRRRIGPLEPHVEQGLATAQDQVLRRVVPFERPHQRARPDVDRKAAADLDARPPVARVMEDRRILVDVQRVVRHEDVGRQQLQHRAVGVAPFVARLEHDPALQRVGADRALVREHVGDVHAVRRQAEPQMHVDRAVDHEVAAVEIEHRRALPDRSRIARRRFRAHRPGRVPDDAGVLGVEQPAGRIGAGFGGLGRGGLRFRRRFGRGLRKQVLQHKRVRDLRISLPRR
eukprot:284818398_6